MKSGGIDAYRIYIDRGLFVYGCINSYTNKFSTYIIDGYNSQLEELINHLENLECQICFNSLKIEYQIIDYIITTREMLLGSLPAVQLELINREALSLCSDDNRITEKDFYIPQIDLSKLLGLNTAIRTTKLSDIAKYFNVDFPSNGDDIFNNITKQYKDVYTKEDILKYIEASVNTIVKLNSEASDNIEARKNISKQFKTKLTLNMSDVKAGEVLLCRLYAKRNNIDLSSFPEPRKDEIDSTFGSVIGAFKFKNKVFEDYVEYLNMLKISKNTSISFKKPVGDIMATFGNGGIHGCCSSGIYESNNNETIIIQDISSFYASVICKFKLKPVHLNDSFVDIYKSIFDYRINNLDNIPESRMLKNMLVGIFGKFKEPNSKLCDPTLQIKISVTAQLCMCEWLDKLINRSGITILGINTDGIILKVRNDMIEYVYGASRLVENEFKTTVKTNTISKLYIKDINNYMYVAQDGNVVKIGCFDDKPSIYKSYKSNIIASVVVNYLLFNGSIDYYRKIYGDDIIKYAFNIIYPLIEKQQTLF